HKLIMPRKRFLCQKGRIPAAGFRENIRLFKRVFDASPAGQAGFVAAIQRRFSLLAHSFSANLQASVPYSSPDRNVAGDRETVYLYWLDEQSQKSGQDRRLLKQSCRMSNTASRSRHRLAQPTRL